MKKRKTILKGVITGDIIDSSKLSQSAYRALTSCIQNTVAALLHLSDMTIDFYRGDSFQIMVDQPQEVIKVAILLRAAVKGQPEPMSDVRLAVGIGTVNYLDQNVSLSNGEAFVLSGHGLDNIGKKRLVVKTPWEQMNESLEISTLFVDDIITGWTVNQAQAAYIEIKDNSTQKAIASQLHISQQNASKLLAKAKTRLVNRYIDYYASLIAQHAQQS